MRQTIQKLEQQERGFQQALDALVEKSQELKSEAERCRELQKASENVRISPPSHVYTAASFATILEAILSSVPCSSQLSSEACKAATREVRQ